MEYVLCMYQMRYKMHVQNAEVIGTRKTFLEQLPDKDLSFSQKPAEVIRFLLRLIQVIFLHLPEVNNHSSTDLSNFIFIN